MNLTKIKAMSSDDVLSCIVLYIPYTNLAVAFDNETETCSSLRRSQRLIVECAINDDLIIKLIFKFISDLQCDEYDHYLGI